MMDLIIRDFSRKTVMTKASVRKRGETGMKM